MIRQIHLTECDSTQDVLKEQLNGLTTHETIVVSCENQVAGRGRGEKKWKALPGTLCFSMNIAPHALMSFTAIELSVIIAQFFEQKGSQLKLKWPNDLWDQNEKKCGGILVQGTQSSMLAGIGLNLYSDDPGFGGIFNKEFSLNKEAYAKEIATFIMDNRIHNVDILVHKWLHRCGHLNQMVRITEGNEVTEGIFQGLGEYGEALVCRDGQTQRVFNGSLRLSN